MLKIRKIAYYDLRIRSSSSAKNGPPIFEKNFKPRIFKGTIGNTRKLRVLSCKTLPFFIDKLNLKLTFRKLTF